MDEQPRGRRSTPGGSRPSPTPPPPPARPAAGRRGRSRCAGRAGRRRRCGTRSVSHRAAAAARARCPTTGTHSPNTKSSRPGGVNWPGVERTVHVTGASGSGAAGEVRRAHGHRRAPAHEVRPRAGLRPPPRTRAAGTPAPGSRGDAASPSDARRGGGEDERGVAEVHGRRQREREVEPAGGAHRRAALRDLVALRVAQHVRPPTAPTPARARRRRRGRGPRAGPSP